MEALRKEVIIQILTNIRDNIKNATEEEYSDNDWYRELIWEDDLEDYFETINYKTVMNIEDRLAIDAVNYPESFPIIGEIVEGITKINNNYWNSPIDVDSEWSAGSFFATRLALASKKAEDLSLFAHHLATRDLDHEADPFCSFGVWEIIKELGYSDKTMPVLIAFFSANSQHRHEYFTWDDIHNITAYLNQGNNLQRFFEQLASWSRKYNTALEEIFELVLSEALELDEDSNEEAEEIFERIVSGGKIPTKDDFSSLKRD